VVALLTFAVTKLKLDRHLTSARPLGGWGLWMAFYHKKVKKTLIARDFEMFVAYFREEVSLYFAGLRLVYGIFVSYNSQHGQKNI
jgi:hypothetical protein